MAVPTRDLLLYDPRWPSMFEEEAAEIRRVLGARAIRIEHVGSTAVPGLAAKPVIDLLVGLASDDLTDEGRRALRKLGYVGRTRVSTQRRYLRKGTPRSHYAHIVRWRDELWERYLVFRDYLRDHAEEALAYGTFKRTAARMTPGEYARLKAEYVDQVLDRANLSLALGVWRPPETGHEESFR